jgi:rSAM/selenodomain-associated transferase 1
MVHALIMAKAPVPGAVKTRLRIEPWQAAELQRASIMDAVAKARALGPVTVAGSPKGQLDLIKPLLPPEVRLIAQVEGDLGQRMRTGTAELLSQSPGPILILGTDAPTLPPDYLRKAARALDDYDASIVPSRDGGYVLLGLKRLHDALFSGIAWSTDIVYLQTMERAKEAGISLLVLEPWYDVDTPADLERLKAELKADPDLAPHTAEVLGRADRR